MNQQEVFIAYVVADSGRKFTSLAQTTVSEAINELRRRVDVTVSRYVTVEKYIRHENGDLSRSEDDWFWVYPSKLYKIA